MALESEVSDAEKSMTGMIIYEIAGCTHSWEFVYRTSSIVVTEFYRCTKCPAQRISTQSRQTQ